MASWKHELVIRADDGADLLRFTFADGRLDVIGDESRWTEAATRFIAEVRRMLAPGTVRPGDMSQAGCSEQYPEGRIPQPHWHGHGAEA